MRPKMERVIVRIATRTMMMVATFQEKASSLSGGCKIGGQKVMLRRCLSFDD